MGLQHAKKRANEIDFDGVLQMPSAPRQRRSCVSNKFRMGGPCGDGTFEMLKKLRPEWAKIIDPNEANIGNEGK